LKGYADALKKNGLRLDKQLVQLGNVSIESGEACMKALLRQAPSLDGVFAVEDFTALGALQVIKESGRNVPADVAIIGFANEAFGAYITPSLSTVDQQTIRMGEEAARLFFDNIEHHDFYKAATRKKVLEPALVFRSSSMRKPL
jgi:LacI family transcriptional regulator